MAEIGYSSLVCPFCGDTVDYIEQSVSDAIELLKWHVYCKHTLESDPRSRRMMVRANRENRPIGPQ